MPEPCRTSRPGKTSVFSNLLDGLSECLAGSQLASVACGSMIAISIQAAPAESAVACERPHTQTVCALCKPVTDNSRMAGKSTRDRIYSESTATWRMRPKEKQSFPRVPLQFWHKGFANLVPFKSRHKLSIGPPAARLHPMHDTS